MRRLAVTTLLIALPLAAGAQARDPAATRAAIRAHRVANDVAVVRELSELLAIPNLASDSVNIRRNARHLMGMLERRGMSARLLEAGGTPPAVYAELRTPGATRTVVFYAHYDGQPVDTTQWLTHPWRPTLRDGLHTAGGKPIELPARAGAMQGEWRMYARSASDDKGPIVALLTAIDALRASRIPLSVNLKVFLDGEEEAGSANVARILRENVELLRADLWIFGDGPVHQSRRQQVVLGVRGVTGLEMTVFGAARGLHSGHYGNWAYNPAALAANLVASMRDDDGRIRIAGFMDDVRPLSPADREALRLVPSPDEALRQELRIAATEAGSAPLNERIMLPALNVRGISGGAVGSSASNTIATTARVSIDFRLVPVQTPARVRSLVEAHCRTQGYHVVVGRDPTDAERAAHPKIVRLDWDDGYPAVRTAVDDPAARAVIAAAEAAIGYRPIVVPTLGGSLPMNDFAEILRAPLIVVPIVNHDNSQHAANENLRLQNLWDGIELYGGILAGLGATWNRIVP